MKSDSSSEKNASRRQFLQGAGAVGSALILGRAGSAEAADDGGERVLKLNEHPDLSKPGGFEIIDVGVDRVIVANTESGYKACSAICPHKGCEVEYNAAAKQFVCPCHKSLFDESGKVLKGPARTGLKPFDATAAVIVKSK
jgi:Rieske Fe-S protein